jgi:hypothetical protein
MVLAGRQVVRLCAVQLGTSIRSLRLLSVHLVWPALLVRVMGFGVRTAADRRLLWFLSIQFQFLSLWVFPARQKKWQRLVLFPVK